MLEKIRATLDVLEGQLQALWADYLSSRPGLWLYKLEHVRAQLIEARRLYDALADLKTRVCDIRSIINDNAQLNPVRKED